VSIYTSQGFVKVTAPHAAKPPVTKPMAVSLALLGNFFSNVDMMEEEEKGKKFNLCNGEFSLK
jgi:hypothetical protein